jgi:hypothetical protein
MSIANQVDILTERIGAIEKKLDLIIDNMGLGDDPKKAKKAKKDKKDKDDSPKKKRVSGYLLFNSAHRDEAKAELEAEAEEGEKIKTTDVTKKLAEMWGAIGDDGKAEWNAKAAEMKAAEE